MAKVRMKKSGDTDKKKNTLPTVTVKSTKTDDKVYGASEKGGEKTLPSATVTGRREKLPAFIYSDEAKSKTWKKNSMKGFSTKELPEVEKAYDMHHNESHWLNKPGAKGNIEVRYSDGGKAKLGEKYVPKDVAGPTDDVKGGWREWHQGAHPEQYTKK